MHYRVLSSYFVAREMEGGRKEDERRMEGGHFEAVLIYYIIRCMRMFVLTFVKRCNFIPRKLKFSFEKFCWFGK